MSAELRMVEGEQQEKVDPLTGTTIDGRYEVDKVLGEGGMGLVYKARHIVLNKPLAIKVLRPDVSRDEEIITRFRQEAQSASAIGNQHIIDISDFGLLPDKSTYFVMEFLDGIDLTGAIERDRQMAAAPIIHIAKQLCRALGAAHDAGIVHRDLKPDNIYLIRRGGDSNFVKVLDFGIAKVGGNSSKLTRAGQVFGTPHYMSPEQCAGSGVDHRTDVYALGVILYEMATGTCPLDADNLMGILTKHLYEEPEKPSVRAPGIPEELEIVILKAMAKKLDERYQSMGELLEDLERLEAGQVTVARETTRGMVLEPATESGGGGRVGLIAATVVLLLGGAGIGIAMSMDEPDPVIAQAPETPPVVVPEVPEVVDEPEPTMDPVGVAEMVVAPVVMVTIDSDPSGTQLWRGAELLGSTPFEIERPTGSERLELSLRRSGYDEQPVQVSSATGRNVTYPLTRQRSSSGMRIRSMTETPTMEAEVSMTSEMAADTTMNRPPSEVLNPWGMN